jgi:hypothetical protein
MVHVMKIATVLNGSIFQGIYAKSESNMHFKNDTLYRNFKGESWAVSRHAHRNAETTRRRSSLQSAGFLTDVMPMLQLLRMMGILPIHFKSNGKLSHSLKQLVIKTKILGIFSILLALL